MQNHYTRPTQPGFGIQNLVLRKKEPKSWSPHNQVKRPAQFGGLDEG